MPRRCNNSACKHAEGAVPDDGHRRAGRRIERAQRTHDARERFEKRRLFVRYVRRFAIAVDVNDALGNGDESLYAPKIIALMIESQSSSCPLPHQ